MKTTVVGNYPKIPSSKDGVNLRRAINREEKGKISSVELEEIRQKTIIRTINDQLDAGVDIITDGQIRWNELTFPMATSMTGALPGGLRRFYDNNNYYRRPQVTDLLTRTKSFVTDEYKFAAEQSDRPVKAVLCGPITFCDMTDNFYYKSFDKTAEAITDLLAEEVSDLISAGCKHIQIDEPSLPLFKHKMGLARELIDRIFAGTKVESSIFIYFNSIAPIAEGLFDLPVNGIGLDLVSHSGDIDLLADFDPDKTLVAGLFDGRNIMLENEKKIRASIEKILTYLDNDKLILSPSCGLEFLPQKYAIAKMKRMTEIAKKLSAGKGK